MSSSHYKRLRATITVCTALGGVLAASPVWAHAKLISSMPPAQSVVPPGPMDITLTFNEPVTPIQCKLVNKDGKEIPGAAPAHAEGAVVHIPITAILPDGMYSVGYRVTGPDAHVSVGAYDFWVQAKH